MTSNINEDKKVLFTDFELPFQEKIVQALLTDRNWASQMSEVLEVEYFEYSHLQLLTEKYLGYYNKHKEFPSLDLMIDIIKAELKNNADLALREQIINVLKKTKANKDLGDLHYVKEKAMEFCRKQKFKNALIDCVELIENQSTYDKAIEIVKKAITAGQLQSPGLSLEDDVDARYSETFRKTIRTNIKTSSGDFSLDDRKILNGGAGSGELNVVIAPTGCHAKDTLILMFDGKLKFVQDIHVGDQIMGPDSRPRTVLQLVRGIDKMYRITPIKGESFVVNENHILSLRETKTGKICNLSVKEYLSKSNNFKHLYKLYRSGPVQFSEESEKKQLPIEPYILGLLLGDGSLSKKRIEVTTADKEIVDVLEGFSCKRNIGLSKHTGKSKSSGYYFTNNGKHNNALRQELEGLELLEKKSGDKFIPFNYKVASLKSRQELLAGLIDTDGSLHHGCYDYISKSKTLAEDVVFVARSLGLAAYPKKVVKSCQTGASGVYYRVSISGNLDQIPCLLVRKKALPRKQKKNSLNTGFTLEALEEDNFYGFTVDRDHLYLMGDFTVSHNCGKSHFLVHVGAQALLQGRNVLHFTFELNERATGVRYDSHLVRIDSLDCFEHKEYIKEFYKENLGKLGKLRIKYLPTGQANVNTLRTFVEKLALENFRPDMIVIDYAGIMRSTERYELERMELKKIYEELRAFANELDLPVWTACQSNKDGADSEIISLKNMAEAYAQAHICDFVIGLGRPEAQKATGRGTIFVAKNRAGLDGLSYKVEINTAQSRITMLSEDEVKAISAEEERAEEDSANFVKKTYRDLQAKKVLKRNSSLEIEPAITKRKDDV